MHTASTLKNTAPTKTSKGHSRRRLVIPAWEDTTFSSYALGGKGHGIARLMALGLPTPPALVISTSLARSYQETGQLPRRLHEQLERELKTLERKTGKCFGDPENPLLVSVRSGAMISMPGMMETVLNVGLTTAVRETFQGRFGEHFANTCNRHLLTGLEPQHWDGTMLAERADLQLRRAIKRVLESWNSPRAKAYRREHSISEGLGTAITIQQMVFGNQAGVSESGTGVAMSHNPDTAEPGLFGDYLQNAQGHDLVSGEMTPEPLSTFAERQPQLTTELERALALLQREVGGPVEVEFTVENGTLYLLQFRRAKLSPEATIIHLVREKHAKRMTREAVMAAVPDSVAAAIETGKQLKVDPTTVGAYLVGTGVGITTSAAVGEIACTSGDAEYWKSLGKPYILVRRETTPDDFELMLGAAGIVTLEGGKTCHAAVVARHQGIPAVIGIGNDAYRFLTDDANSLFTITIDPTSGNIWYGPVPLTESHQCKEIELFLRWRHLSKPVIDPTLCTVAFATNTALNDFYLAEAMLADCSDPALAAKIRAVHQQLTTKTSAVFSTYLALAVASEVTYADEGERHLSPSVREAFINLKLRFTLQHRDAWSDFVVPAIIHELAATNTAAVVDFFRICKDVFASGSWSGSIGGQAWADIATVGEQYWNGDIPDAVFVDRVFNLRHNNGPVFNKHDMVCYNYDRSRLSAQLDRKREQLPVAKKWEAMRAIHAGVNEELFVLYSEGLRKGVWKHE